MNAEANHELWTRYLDGQRLDSTERDALIAILTENGELRDQSRVDLAVDRLLRLIAVPEQKSFVDSCLDRYAGGQSAGAGRQPEIGIDIVPKRKRTGGNLADLLGNRRKSARNRSISISAILATASLILIACFVFVQNRNGRVKDNDMATGKPGVVEQDEGDRQDRSNERQPRELPLLAGDDLENMEAAEASPSVNSSNDDPVGGETEQEMPKPQLANHGPGENENELDPKLTFATVKAQSSAKWLSNPVEGRLGVGSHKLIFGSATIVMDNGLSIRLIAPAEIRLPSDKQLWIESGKVQFESPPGLAEFSVETPDAVLATVGSSAVYVFVDSEGSEVVLSSGRIDLFRRASAAENESVEPMRIGVNGLHHAFIQAGSDENSLPSIAIAHGSGKYLAQICFTDMAVQVLDPGGFDRLIDRIRAEDIRAEDFTDALKVNQGRANVLDKINRFNAMVRQIQSLPPGERNSGSRQESYSFQGEITIDGNRVGFASPEESRKFLDELNRRN